MNTFKSWCVLCGKKLKKGDPVIRLGELQICHPDCYKEKLEKTYEEVGLFEQRSLREARSYLNAFKALANSESVSSSKSFYEAWGNQLFSFDLLSSVILFAEISGSLGFLQKIRLKRMLEKYRKTLMDIGASYLEDYGNIQIARKMKDLYPSFGEPTLEQLKEGEMEALDIIKRQINELCNNVETLYDDLKKISNKTVQRTREQITRKIRGIPKHIKKLDC